MHAAAGSGEGRDTGYAPRGSGLRTQPSFRLASPMPMRRRTLLILVALGLLAAAAVWVWRVGMLSLHTTHASPDGRFAVEVYARPRLVATPGSGSDAPGVVRLREVATGRVLGSAPVELVQLADHVAWTDSTVDLKLVAQWALPE